MKFNLIIASLILGLGSVASAEVFETFSTCSSADKSVQIEVYNSIDSLEKDELTHRGILKISSLDGVNLMQDGFVKNKYDSYGNLSKYIVSFDSNASAFAIKKTGNKFTLDRFKEGRFTTLLPNLEFTCSK